MPRSFFELLSLVSTWLLHELSREEFAALSSRSKHAILHSEIKDFVSISSTREKKRDDHNLIVIVRQPSIFYSVQQATGQLYTIFFFFFFFFHLTWLLLPFCNAYTRSSDNAARFVQCSARLCVAIHRKLIVINERIFLARKGKRSFFPHPCGNSSSTRGFHSWTSLTRSNNQLCEKSTRRQRADAFQFLRFFFFPPLERGKPIPSVNFLSLSLLIINVLVWTCELINHSSIIDKAYCPMDKPDAFEKCNVPWLLRYHKRTFSLREAVRYSVKGNGEQPVRESAGKFYYSHFHQFSVEPVILQIFFVGRVYFHCRESNQHR